MKTNSVLCISLTTITATRFDEIHSSLSLGGKKGKKKKRDRKTNTKPSPEFSTDYRKSYFARTEATQISLCSALVSLIDMQSMEPSSTVV